MLNNIHVTPPYEVFMQVCNSEYYSQELFTPGVLKRSESVGQTNITAYRKAHIIPQTDSQISQQFNKEIIRILNTPIDINNSYFEINCLIPKPSFQPSHIKRFLDAGLNPEEVPAAGNVRILLSIPNLAESVFKNQRSDLFRILAFCGLQKVPAQIDGKKELSYMEIQKAVAKNLPSQETISKYLHQTLESTILVFENNLFSIVENYVDPKLIRREMLYQGCIQEEERMKQLEEKSSASSAMLIEKD